MINFGPLLPPVSTPKTTKVSPKEAAVAGSEINKDPMAVPTPLPKQQQRRGKDRRQRHQRPLIELRSGRDRRENAQTPSIDINV